MAGGAPNVNYETFAGNQFAVQSPPIKWDAVDAPTSKTYHGITIAVDGNVVGRIQNWNTSGAYTREGVHIYELNDKTWGLPVDYVPGRATGFTITATVAEMWGREVEIQLGIAVPGDQIWNLIHQTRPFTAHEFWFRGVDTYRIWKYRGCWLTDRNETEYSAAGDARVVANFNFNYVSRQLVYGGSNTIGGAIA